MPAPPPDVPMIRGGNGQCTVWQRLRKKVASHAAAAA
jgi:hypothetical protein